MRIVKKFSFLLVIIFSFSLFSGFYTPAKDYIKWVDCNIPYEVMLAAYEYDKQFHSSDEVEFDFIKSLAYLATKNANKFRTQNDKNELKKLVEELKNGKKIDDFYGENKYYKYYLQAYDAIFAQFLGEYKDADGNIQYGLKNYHPIAKGFWYNHYDDFGNSRNFGFKRKHLGHDMMGSIGTPIIAVEGGIITDIGWNRYGGWRISIRSNDKKRSYYYAHLRKGKPYAGDLKIGDSVIAGDVIGYLGVTGYSTKENANMKCKPHLHIGMQLIFDESQVKGAGEIWIDMYQICKFLSHNRATVYKDGDDYKSTTQQKALTPSS